MSPLTRALAALLLSLALAAATGCVKDHDHPVWDPATGHPQDWVQGHGAVFSSDRTECTGCHGEDLLGGIAKVSCFSTSFEGTACHAAGPVAFGHGAGWGEGNQHGAAAKADPGAATGLAYCATCHGADFAGGTSGTGCFSCHGVQAPHPRQPWTGGNFSHTTAGAGNAPVCANCHRSAAGTPGCFNNTLCHGPGGGHPAGFGAPGAHGPVAKAAPGGSTGFASCKTCHGANFSGGISGTSCFTYHGVSAPHSPRPWLSHTTTNTGNAGVCADCHRSAAGTAGCFNNTLCHGAAFHPDGWSAPARHGPPAKAAPGSASGFDYCATCHGSQFSGGTSGTSCYTCHGVDAPHPPGPWLGTYTHVNVNQGNLSVCARCHRSAAGTPGCFNGTLCHSNPHPSGWGSATQHGPAAKAAPSSTQGFASCQPCHGTNFAGGVSNESCFTCHGVSAPHSPRPWLGGTFTHDNTDEGNAPVCAACHRSASGTAGCFNGTLCHAVPG